MREVQFPTRQAATLARLDHLKVIRLFDVPECAQNFAAPADNGCTRLFNPRQTFALIQIAKFTRWGLTAPHAGRVVTRLIEEVAIHDPNASVARIEFRENGASFIFIGEAPASDAAEAAGPIEFTVTIDLARTWATINDAIGNQPVVIGGEDD